MKTDETTPPTESPMRHYVCGFLICGPNVALIKKERPVEQKGKWNGIGGKIEPGETPLEAMIREFREEAGHDRGDWKQFCTLTGKDRSWRVNFFRAFQSFDGTVPRLTSMTDEVVCFWRMEDVRDGNIPIVPNLRWLIPMAQDHDITADVRENVPHGTFEKPHLDMISLLTEDEVKFKTSQRQQDFVNAHLEEMAREIQVEQRDPSKAFPTCAEVNDLFKESLIACPVCGHREKISFSGPCPQCSQAAFCKED